jgi:hypothetical protein
VSIRVSSEDNDNVGENDGEGNTVTSVEVGSMQRKSCEYSLDSGLAVSAAGKGIRY